MCSNHGFWSLHLCIWVIKASWELDVVDKIWVGDWLDHFQDDNHFSSELVLCCASHLKLENIV
jgi:hypothetical protein